MSATDERFAGAAALLTVGAHGIGKVCAVRLAAEGARCAVADLDGSAAERVAAGLGGGSAGHLGVVIDVTQAASVADTVAAMRSASVRPAPPGNLSEINFGIGIGPGRDRDRDVAMALP